MKYIRKLSKLFIIGIIFVLFIDFSITYKAKNQVFDDVKTIKTNKVGLVLGAGKYTTYGNVNLYYKYRLEAAYQLYKSGKINVILISGDNSRKDYDEPTDFKIDLIKMGVPENKIVLDYAGFRTLDSVVRAKEIFGLSEMTIISQKFHNERALFLARHFNINAIGFNAKSVSRRYS
ncbi:UNVERIFIED_CONTAM: hypothetical protein GTU68_050726, partial [Idotea baltica]|nr:hypothetical protein [Idotea baltica]